MILFNNHYFKYVLLLALCCGTVYGANVSVNVGKFETPPGKSIQKELEIYLDKMFKDSFSITQQESNAAIIVGTTKTNPWIKKMVEEKKISLPEGKNADQGFSIKTISGRIYIAAITEVGALYGVYELLEEYGAYFQITGERIPAETSFGIKKLDITNSPVFKYRGLMPWDNFMCGMSGYNLKDCKELIDRATRMRYNKMDLHFYAGYVMYTEKWNGKAVAPSWPMMGKEYAPKGKPGEKAFGNLNLFCVDPWEENKGDPLKQAEACQQMFRDMIDYGHTKGWAFAAGFALMRPKGGDFTYLKKSNENGGGTFKVPDPLVEKNIDLHLQRYRRLKEIYPKADYYWLWQDEGGGGLGRNISSTPGHKEFREKYSYWGEDALAGDRDYAYTVLKMAEKMTSEERSKLATGGWSIQGLFPGIDKDFPEEIIFASLNNAKPWKSLLQLENYKVAKNGRRAWMISWWEYDGNQWFPQWRSTSHEKKYNKAVEYGVEGVSQLGWKTSALEHAPRYLAEFAWNPGLSKGDFYKKYCAKLYGSKVADEMAELYELYEEWEPKTPPAVPGRRRHMVLACGWAPLAIVDVPFTKEGLEQKKWKTDVGAAKWIHDEQVVFRKVDIASIAKLRSLLPQMDATGQYWAKLLINRFECRVLYLNATIQVNQAYMEYDKVFRLKTIKEAAAAAKKHTEQAVAFAEMAIEKYAEDIRNRGDMGVVAQMNTQFYDMIKGFHEEFSLSSYASLDQERFAANVAIKSNFSDPNAWPKRGGVCATTTFTDGADPALRLSLGGKGSRFDCVWIHQGEIDLVEAPYFDLFIKTTTHQPLSILFRAEGKDTWYEIALVHNNRYKLVDVIPATAEINDGKWHRITWNLKKLVNEKIGMDVNKISEMTIGNWQPQDDPVVVEFKRVTFGTPNMLDGLEVDNSK